MRFSAMVLFFAAVWGAAAQETLTLPVGPVGVEAMQFELRASGATRMPGGILYVGDAAVVTPLGRLVMAQSELFFGYAEGSEQVQTVRGKAFVPTPLSGEEVSIDEPVMAELGYDLGANLKDLGVPLMDQRGYLFFKFDAGLTMRVGKAPPEDLEEEEDVSFTISFPAGASARIVVDPLDPMYYFAGSVTTPNKKKGEGEEGGAGNGGSGGSGNGGSGGSGSGGGEGGSGGTGGTGAEGEDGGEDDGIETGSGSSVQGLFPFRPLVTWGIEDKAREFSGHRITTGTFPLFGLPVQVRGHLITNLDPLATGELAVDPLGIGFGPVVQAGANGRFALSLDYLKVTGLGSLLNLTVPLGKATAAVEIVSDRQLAYISGILDPATPFAMGLWLQQDGELKAAALASTDVAESRLYLDGLYKVGASEFAKLVGFPVGDVLRMEARLRADRAGLYARGLTESAANMGPVRSRDRVTLELEIPADDPAKRYLQMSGLIEFAGMGMEGAARVSGSGLAAAGKVKAPRFELALNGGVQGQPSGPTFVFGSMSVPDALQPDMQGEIRAAARAVQSDLDSKLSAYEEATKGYEFELSLRGMRAVVPPVTDAIIAEIDRGITTNLNARWPKINTIFGPIEAPGKSVALGIAREQAEPYKARLRELKRLMQTGDSATVRAALDAAIRAALANTRLRITYRVPVVGTTITIYDGVILDATMVSRLNLALAGVRALPEASSRKVSAEQIWNQVPKREILRQVGDAIEKGITAAIPRIESIGFRFPLGQAEWDYQVTMTQGGKRSVVTVKLAPSNIGSVGTVIGQVFARTL